MSNAWRNDGVAKVTGKAKFTDDLFVENMLHAVPVYSQKYIHGKILGYTGLEEAAACPGVVRVITSKDVPGAARFGQIHKDYAMLTVDKIRCESDVLALVVAESRPEALTAATLIEAVVEEHPPLFDPIAAMEETENLIHPSKGSNIINQHKIRRGKDINEAFSECDHILERDYTTAAVEHAYMEVESSLCQERPDGVMEVYGGMQHPFSTRRFVAALLGRPLADVEIVGTPVGGGFGGKDDTIAIVCARTALACHLCGRPVKMVYDREWSMKESYKRHPYNMYYKIGLKGNKIHAVDARFVADGGAYTSVTPWVTWRSTVQCCGPYQVDNVHCDTFGVHTNNVFTGAYRGFGAVQVNYAIEQWIEECAQVLEMDPVEFRRANMVTQGCETITSQKLDNHVVSMEEVMDKALKLSDYSRKSRANDRGQKDGKNYGIGMAISYRGCSLGAEGMDFCSAIINCQFDGSVLLETGVHENGQGAEAAMVLILAKELGINKERIRYCRPSTSHIPDGGTTVASRGTLMGGGAVANGVKNLKKIIAQSLHNKLECQVDEVRFKDDKVYGKTDEAVLTWEEAMHQLFLNCDYPYAFGSFQAPKVSWDEETGKGNAYFTWGYSCQIAEVEVDKATGKIQLLDVYAVHDIGKAINPEYLQGQIYGGFTQGYGMAVMEDLNIVDGRLKHDNLNRYRIPRATDVGEFHTEIVENHDPNSPTGAKGVGEPALEIAAAATANAVYAATGCRCNAYPIKAKELAGEMK
ncbi:MAG: xanthine dehydrogenase family protein molybdopterin-binding subunit [Spirochaetales bacterium]|nr:xanthine dehydrogenase family protein molybdopterin-binding subunit [Spirochaetales bacterium]